MNEPFSFAGWGRSDREAGLPEAPGTLFSSDNDRQQYRDAYFGRPTRPRVRQVPTTFLTQEMAGDSCYGLACSGDTHWAVPGSGVFPPPGPSGW